MIERCMWHLAPALLAVACCAGTVYGQDAPAAQIQVAVELVSPSASPDRPTAVRIRDTGTNLPDRASLRIELLRAHPPRQSEAPADMATTAGLSIRNTITRTPFDFEAFGGRLTGLPAGWYLLKISLDAWQRAEVLKQFGDVLPDVSQSVLIRFGALPDLLHATQSDFEACMAGFDEVVDLVASFEHEFNASPAEFASDKNRKRRDIDMMKRLQDGRANSLSKMDKATLRPGFCQLFLVYSTCRDRIGILGDRIQKNGTCSETDAIHFSDVVLNGRASTTAAALAYLTMAQREQCDELLRLLEAHAAQQAENDKAWTEAAAKWEKTFQAAQALFAACLEHHSAESLKRMTDQIENSAQDKSGEGPSALKNYVMIWKHRRAEKSFETLATAAASIGQYLAAAPKSDRSEPKALQGTIAELRSSCDTLDALFADWIPETR